MKVSPSVLRFLFWSRDFIKGSPIRREYNDIKRIFENHDYGIQQQRKNLNLLLNHVLTYAPFYQKYKDKRFADYPVVNKSILLENYDLIKIDPTEIPNHKGVLHIQKTSGSTGTPFAIPQDFRKRNRRLAESKYFGKVVGFDSHEKLVHLRAWNRWQNKSKVQSFRENIIAFDIAHLGEERLSELCEIIKKQKVVALRGYASSIDLFAKYAVQNKIKFPSLHIIISGSETLQEATRQLVNQQLGCNIISQYANEENGILTQESPAITEKHHFYLNHASYFFEILKFENDEPAAFGELGRIVVTDLFNYAFPMIRYDTGDSGIMLEKDLLSQGYPVLQSLYGRRIDIIYDIQGHPVHPTSIGRTLKNVENIRQWQFIQKGQKDYVLKLNIKGQINAEKCLTMLYDLVGEDANISIEFVHEIPVLSSGKENP